MAERIAGIDLARDAVGLRVVTDANTGVAITCDVDSRPN